MRRFALPLFAVALFGALLVTGCRPDAPTEVGGPSSGAPSVGGATLAGLTEVPGMSRYALAEPIQVNNVSIVPVISREGETQIGDDYATLAEAKKNAWIEIIEIPGEGEVDTLRVHNVGPKPILLLSGELLLGGKQDRVVAKDTIVPPGKEVEVPVYCVEPGRWTGSQKFSSGDTMVPLSVKEEATFGNQQAVWDKVGGYNAAAGAGRGGGTTVQNGLDEEKVRKQIASDLDSVLSKLDKHKNVVGVMFLMDGEVRTLELFGNNRLFNQSRNSMLKGALAQAAVGGKAPGAKVDMKDCAKFMSEAMQSNRVVESRTPSSVAARRASENSKGVEVHAPSKDGEAGGSALLHGSYKKQ